MLLLLLLLPLLQQGLARMTAAASSPTFQDPIQRSNRRSLVSRSHQARPNTALTLFLIRRKKLVPFLLSALLLAPLLLLPPLPPPPAAAGTPGDGTQKHTWHGSVAPRQDTSPSAPLYIRFKECSKRHSDGSAHPSSQGSASASIVKNAASI